MKSVARSLAAALLMIPAAGFAQSFGLDVPRGGSSNNVPAFFTFMNAEVARLGSDHLIVVSKPPCKDAIRESEMAAFAAARRRAVIRIATGYDPALAFLQELKVARRKNAGTS